MSGKQNTYHEKIIDSVNFPKEHTVKFPFIATKISIMNDDLKPLDYSFNGRDIDGVINWDDASHNLSNISVSRIWFRTTEPNAKIRIFAWTAI